MAKSPMDELKHLDKRREELLGEVRGSAESNLRKALRDFNDLGLGMTYKLRVSGRGSGRRGTRQVNANRACPICGFRTVPPHDARAHRSQGDKKKAFTADELSAKGMQKA